MLIRFYNLCWAVTLEAGFASMWQDEYPLKRAVHREAYIESAAIMQATRDIGARAIHQLASAIIETDPWDQS